MTNEVSAFSAAGLPNIKSMVSAYRRNMSAIAKPSMQVLLKFDKTSAWTFGPDAEEVEAGSEWAVNPYSFSHGFIAWGEGSPVGEVTVSMTEDLPDPGPTPAGADQKGWQRQVGFNLKCVSGQDEGLEVRYAHTSMGAHRAVQTLGLTIAEQIDRDQTKPVAIITLDKDSYKHNSYGRVFVPVFKLVRFVGLEGPAVEDTAEAKSPPKVSEVIPTADVEVSRRRRIGV